MKKLLPIILALALAAGLQAQTGIADLIVARTFRTNTSIAPTSLSADQNDYAPTGYNACTVMQLSGGAAHNITGIAGGSAGRFLFVTNVGSYNLTLVNASSSSTAANRFAFTADLVVEPSITVLLIYDGTNSRWRLAQAVGTASDVTGVAQGGTGIASYAVGDLIYASASTTLSKLADVAVGSVLESGGVTTAPAWGSTLGLGTAAVAEKSIKTALTVTDVSNGAVLLGQLNLFSTVSESTVGSGFNINVNVNVLTGKTNSGAGMTGLGFTILRNQSSGTSGFDSGTLTNMFGADIAYGHYNTSGETPTTTNVYGLRLEPYARTGTITNLWDLYITAPSSGGTVGTHYAIFQADSAGLNSFAGSSTFASTTDASSSTAAAVVITGGLGVAKKIIGASTIATADPTNGSGAWMLGKVRTSTGLIVSTTTGMQIKVDGTLYTLAVLSTNP